MIAVFLLLLAACCLWQARRRGPTDPDGLSPESTNVLKGVCAVLIVLHHLSQRAASDGLKGVLGTAAAAPAMALKYLGYAFVGVFFLISGFGLMSSAMKRGSAKGLLRRRLCSLYAPYWIMNLLWIVYGFIAGHPYSLGETLFSLAGGYAFTHLWYTTTLILLTAAFTLIFRRGVSGRGVAAVCGVSLIYCLVCLFAPLEVLWTEGKPSLRAFQIAWSASALCFPAGVVLRWRREQAEALVSRRPLACFLGCAAVFAAAFGVRLVLERLGQGENIPLQFLPRNLIALAFAGMALIALRRFRLGNPALRWLGAHSLEIYMMQFLLLEICVDTGLRTGQPSVYTAAVMLGTLLGAALLHPLDTLAVKALVPGKN